MADTVTFNGSPVLDTGEGIILSCSRGVINRDKIFEPMARGDGEFVKFLNKKGVDHQVTIKFIECGGTGNPSVSTIVTRMQQLADSKVINSLSVPAFGISVNNCVVSDVQETANEPTFGYSLVEETIVVAEMRNITYDITFRQLK